MPFPEVTVVRGDRGPLPIAADDVSTRFEAVICERGPVGVPIDCRSWAQVRDAGTDATDATSTVSLGGVGDHTAFSTLRAVDRHFAEGGTRAILSRTVGPAARTAVLALRDGAAATVITITAAGPGDWYHRIRAVVTRGTGDERIITITLDDVEIVSGTAADADEAADIINAAGYVTAVPGAGTWPIIALASTALAGGDDDRANITDREVDAARAVSTSVLGAGALTASGWTTVTTHRALATEAAATNRQARGDLPDIADAATLIAQAAQIRALGGPTAGRIKLLAGWPLQDVAGVRVPVAPSGWVTGREALADREYREGPGQPAAQTFGIFAGAVGVSQRWSRADLKAMLNAGITPIVQDARTGVVYALDSITAADPATYPQYEQDACMRVVMAIHAQIERVLEQRVLQVMVPHVVPGTTSDCVAICGRWFDRGALTDEYGDPFVIEVVADQARRSLTGNVEVTPTGSTQSVQFTITATAPGGAS